MVILYIYAIAIIISKMMNTSNGNDKETKEIWFYLMNPILLFLVIFACLFYPLKAESQSFSFGLIADCQYRGEPGNGIRQYTISDKKLMDCVRHFNTLDLEYVVHLGDFIDKDISSYDVVGPIYHQLKMPKYHVLGNHDFSVDDTRKNEVPQILGLSSRYYDFKMNDWRFVVLDGNDISFHAYPEDDEKYAEAESYYTENNIESPKWNGALSKKQLDWLTGVLQKASELKEQVIIYCHFPVFPENIHNLWNAIEVVELIEGYACVKAFINGHNHAGNYGIKEGVHYLTLHGMVDTDETSYAVIEVDKEQLIVKGFGREKPRMLKIR